MADDDGIGPDWEAEIADLRRRMEARGHRADALDNEEMAALAGDCRIPSDILPYVIGRIVLALHRWEPPPGLNRPTKNVEVQETDYDGLIFSVRMEVLGTDRHAPPRIGVVQYAIGRRELLHSDTDGLVRHVTYTLTAQARRIVQEARGTADRVDSASMAFRNAAARETFDDIQRRIDDHDGDDR
jgi:hypothetical protein